jgi:hypothetical protein
VAQTIETGDLVKAEIMPLAQLCGAAIVTAACQNVT